MATETEIKYQAVTIKDDRGFASALKKAKDGVENGFTQIQECVLYGLEKFKTHSADTSYLSRAMDLCMSLKGTNPNQLKAYIQEHANVMWRKAPDGTNKFGKTGKGPANVTMPVEGYFWFDQVSERVVVRPDMVDPIDLLLKLVEKIEKKASEGKVPQERLALFEEFKGRNSDLLHMEPLPKEQLFSKTEGVVAEVPAQDKAA